MKQIVRVALSTTAALALAGTLSGCFGLGGTGTSTSNSASKPAAASSSAATAASSADSSASASEAPQVQVERTDMEIIDEVINNFEQLAAIPRQSGNEQQVSNFLKAWAEERGLSVTQDSANNIVFDVPATSGLEDLPRVGLQAHMDMVCVAAPGVAYDPTWDAIRLVRNDAADTLTADGTSLGADDGMGVALIMAIADGQIEHGPLRVFFTTDEEVGMGGAAAIDPAFVTDLSYLINIDGEEADTVIVSSAGGETIEAVSSLELVAPAGNTAATITLDGLLGGHSGLQINEGRCNAVVAMGDLIQYFTDSGLSYELAAFSGGTATNAIPASASITIVFADTDWDTFQTYVSTYETSLRDAFAGFEPNISMRMDATALPEWVFTTESGSNVLSYALGVYDGVYTMSEDVEGLVESSSNLGIFSANTSDGFIARTFIRSSNRDRLAELEAQQLGVAAAEGFDVAIGDYIDTWPYNQDSKLRPLCERVYEEQVGTPIRIEAIHAALECGAFAEKNPALDIISIGPTITGVHSPDETVVLSSIPTTWRLLAGILAAVE